MLGKLLLLLLAPSAFSAAPVAAAAIAALLALLALLLRLLLGRAAGEMGVGAGRLEEGGLLGQEREEVPDGLIDEGREAGVEDRQRLSNRREALDSGQERREDGVVAGAVLSRDLESRQQERCLARFEVADGEERLAERLRVATPCRARSAS